MTQMLKGRSNVAYPETNILTRATKSYHKHHSVTLITAMQSNQDTGDKLTTP
jgi:hypothetical protein